MEEKINKLIVQSTLDKAISKIVGFQTEEKPFSTTWQQYACVLVTLYAVKNELLK